MADRVKIVEVGPRDGLQNESAHLSPSVRVELISRLVESGLKEIEVGAFVSPKWVPQMSGTDRVIRSLKKKFDFKKTSFSALVPNVRGMEEALKSGIREVAIFGSVSESFSKSNINASRSESLKRFRDVVDLAKSSNVKVRGYLSTVFGCPFEGKVKVSEVVRVAERYWDLGIYELSFGDTIGVATPRDIEKVIQAVCSSLPMDKIAMHFHDTRGTGLANALRSLDMGVRILDSSVGGLGGCPYAPAATGNIATEDLVYMLHGMGLRTGIDLEALLQVSQWTSKKIGRPLPSRLSLAGMPKKKKLGV